jgi:hypothetical protein
MHTCLLDGGVRVVNHNRGLASLEAPNLAPQHTGNSDTYTQTPTSPRPQLTVTHKHPPPLKNQTQKPKPKALTKA